MKKLPSVKDLSIEQKTVLLRTNYDVPLREGQVVDGTRISESLPTINYLLEQKAKIILLSHLGRPGGKVVPELSFKPVEKVLTLLLHGDRVKLLENLRFWPGEEANDLSFAQSLASLGDFFVNEAFACSHRQHASIVGLPKFLPSAFGFDFLKEVEVLSEIKEKPYRPVTLILGGAKEDKLEVVEKLLNWADKILIGGKLPQLVSKSYPEKVMMAQLNPQGKDITLESINQFKEIISLSGTILWAGPMGVFEEIENEEGTKQIAQAILASQAFKVVGGGDTEAALTKFNLEAKVDYLSSGGGAMFEFLAKGTLPGIEAITKKNF
ncbi:phosphoglycerate kinase [Candidatus Shapirobacteria bacterium CG10_big_fil_rev_8_21_14_0_10_38_8]|nr:MAG: phosphoglycerate kinase [Candidatus Shapirobacteria bacterium CG10_big_fil_rev_8_21_14_0_10_38_8]